MPEGTPILAAHDAIVFNVKDNPNGYGKYVLLVSGERQDKTYISTIYGHCRNIIVVPGQLVVAGQQIAEMSNTGFVISGGTAYWNTAPEGRGVHLHFGVMILTDPIPGTQQLGANGMSFTIKDYSLNGMHGWINPMQFLNDMLKLKRQKGRREVFAVINGRNYYLSGEAFADFVTEGLAKWEDIVEVDEEINLDSVIK